MFFKSRKQTKLEENRKKYQKRQEDEKAKQEHEYNVAFTANKEIFKKICHMVRSLPKERQIVVVQRVDIFVDNHDRNECYMDMAQLMSKAHRLSGREWIHGYNDSLYAFYKPNWFTCSFMEALLEFSKDGYRIQRIRYYRDKF